MQCVEEVAVYELECCRINKMAAVAWFLGGGNKALGAFVAEIKSVICELLFYSCNWFGCARHLNGRTGWIATAAKYIEGRFSGIGYLLFFLQTQCKRIFCNVQNFH